MYVIHAENAGKNNGFTVVATSSNSDGKLSTMEVAAYVETEEEAKAIAAKFPKGVKLKGGAIHTSEGLKGWVSMRLYFNVDGVTGDKNETAIKRITNFFKAADKLGFKLFCEDTHYSNQIKGREVIEAAIAAL